MFTSPARDVWDVVVVGAGPAGCSAARSAALGGARTLLIERAAVPRYKTCGGGLVGVSLASLPPGMRPPVRDSITAVTFSYLGKRMRTRSHDSPFIEMVDRAEFDGALTAAAQEAGSTLQDKTLVRNIQVVSGLAELTTDRGIIVSRAVVGADGSASRIGRFVGVDCAQIDLGLEVELEAGDQADVWRGRIHLDWGPISGSYAWVFPKGRTLTVGAIAVKGNSAATQEYLNEFIDSMGLKDLKVLQSSGHLTRCRSTDSPLAHGRVLVAGDAAGLIEPWTREGISFALRSGHLAGLSAARISQLDNDDAEREGAAYARRIEGSLGNEMRAGQRLYAVFSKRPVLFHLAMADTMAGWQAFVRLSRGDTNFERILRHKPIAMIARILS
jgi:geranylgeranyl reductase family protein